MTCEDQFLEGFWPEIICQEKLTLQLTSRFPRNAWYTLQVHYIVNHCCSGSHDPTHYPQITCFSFSRWEDHCNPWVFSSRFFIWSIHKLFNRPALEIFLIYISRTLLPIWNFPQTIVYTLRMRKIFFLALTLSIQPKIFPRIVSELRTSALPSSRALLELRIFASPCSRALLELRIAALPISRALSKLKICTNSGAFSELRISALSTSRRVTKQNREISKMIVCVLRSHICGGLRILGLWGYDLWGSVLGRILAWDNLPRETYPPTYVAFPEKRLVHSASSLIIDTFRHT